MERPSGPLGAATQSTGRLPDSSSSNVTSAPPTRRPVGAPPPPMLNTSLVPPTAPPMPPMPTLRNVPSNSTLSATGAPMSAGMVVSLVREAMRNALDENETQAAEASAVSNDLKPGVTIDLSRKNINKLPDEVVDEIKHELERLALSHNNLTAFPLRFSECTSLRYLNVRNNKIRDFPLPLCDLRALEILDLGRNRLQVLPPEIVKLASLKVFAVQKNKIEELPLCLADMVSLQVLKLEGNPIRFPPPEVLQVKASSPPNEGYLKDKEVTEVAVTTHIKKWLRERAIALNDLKVETDTAGEESSEGGETPRLPIKRVMSGRFPIKVNGAELPDLRSPNMARPPPIPTRSHYRGLSQQNAAVRRPGVMPLTIGNVNERLRSNSETLLQASRAERPESRQRRMGIVSKKTTELGTLDEGQANNRFSHYRGLSHGSAMQGNGNSMAVKSPSSPAAAEPILQRPVYVRRLSVLPERRRESKVYDPVVEAAKGILYSVFQIHPMIQMLMSLTSDGSSKRSSLEIVFYNTNSHVEELEQEIQRHDPSADGDNYAVRENESVQRACQTLVSAYTHVCTLLASNIDSFVDNGDQRYIRTLLMLLYNSITELRATLYANGPPDVYRSDSYRKPVPRPFIENTIRPHSRENSVTPTADRAGIIQRPRNGTFVHNPSNLRVATDVPLPYTNGNGASRTATITSATPRSGESFASSASAGRGLSEFTEEDRQFERIFLSLQKSSDLVMRTLPAFNQQLTTGLRNAMGQRAPEEVLRCWKALIAKCNTTIQQTEFLKSRMSLIKLKEPGIRTQNAFWSLCNNFIESWVSFADKVKEGVTLVALPPDSRMRLKPIQQSMKETRDSIVQSTWSYCLRQSMASGVTSPFGSQAVQLPMTPQSAALGPAVQATVPSTPQSASFQTGFGGGVFGRSDTMISTGGGSGMSMSSRAGTMTGSSGYGSISGISMSTDVSSVLSPPPSFGPPGGGFGQVPIRLNGGKVAF